MPAVGVTSLLMFASAPLHTLYAAMSRLRYDSFIDIAAAIC